MLFVEFTWVMEVTFIMEPDIRDMNTSQTHKDIMGVANRARLISHR